MLMLLGQLPQPEAAPALCHYVKLRNCAVKEEPWKIILIVFVRFFCC